MEPQSTPPERGTPEHPIIPPPASGPEVPRLRPARYRDVSAHEIGVGKPAGVLCYALNFLALPFFFIPLIVRNNEFALFHAKQSLMVWVATILGFLICFGMIFAFGIGIFLFPVWAALIVTWNVIGIVNACYGRFKPLPLIGPNAERSFANVHATPATA